MKSVSPLVCGGLLCLLLFVAGGFAQENTPAPPSSEHKEAEHREAEREIKQQERQRILGIVPEFNTTSLQRAAKLSPGEKFRLAFKSATDPFAFITAGADAGISQWGNDFAGYGQGAQGYGKRFGASYADSFDGTILGNAFFPVLLHQDPRYFRKGTGSIGSRALYAVLSTFRAKSDNGKWQPNFSNILGNLAAGGISNLYYPPSDRGATLTIQRGITVSLEGALGALGYEFWPDVARRLRRKHKP